MRLAERVASALERLHATHVLHGSLCPAALRLAPPELPGAPAESAALDPAAGAAGVRVMLGEFSDACAVAPPEYTVANAHATAGLSAAAEPYAAPERLDREAGILRTQTDMFAFAATMYHLLTGVTPALATDPAAAPVASATTAPTGGNKPGINSRITAGLERVKSFTGVQHSAAGEAAAAEKACGAPSEFFELLRECMETRAERRPRAEEAARRLAFILSEGDVKDGRFVYRRARTTSQASSKTSVVPPRPLTPDPCPLPLAPCDASLPSFHSCV